MNSFHRAVRQYLREHYRVEPFLSRGGKHPFFMVAYDNRRHRLTLPGTPSDHRALDNMKSTIHTLLGPPPSTPDKPPRRNLEDE